MEHHGFAFLLKEFEKLKDEQQKRIEFRDQMIYLTLGAIGAIFSFALEKPRFDVAFLVLPFLCIVMGWTYMSNDKKISAIGLYIRKALIPKVCQAFPENLELLTGSWEEYSKNDPQRKARKIFQLFIDLALFCFSSVISITVFFILHQSMVWYFYFFATIELLVVLYLCIQFCRSAEIGNK